MPNLLNLLLIMVIGSLLILTGCHKHFTEQPQVESPSSLREAKPYPAMDSFVFENISFGFALKLSDLPPKIIDTPKYIDIGKTIHGNRGYSNIEGTENTQLLLRCLKKGQFSGISVNGVKNKIFSLTGETSRPGMAPANRDVTYSIETTPNLEMLSLKKETRYTKSYLKTNDFNNTVFLQRLIKTYGPPHYTHVKANHTGTFSHYWWGADEEILLAGKGYNYLNASHWNGFRGKTFFVSIHKYSSGDIIVGETMKDNFKAFQNQLKKESINMAASRSN